MADQHSVKVDTDYIILRYLVTDDASGRDEYEVVARVFAKSHDRAIRTHCEKAGAAAAGTYIAVPARSWNPIQVEPQTIVQLSLKAVQS